MRALCKLHGQLVIAEISRDERAKGCPVCRTDNSHEYQGWIECMECGFSILLSDMEKWSTV